MKKQLLNESEVRKMMKFANIGALSNGFVERLTEAEELEESTDTLEEGEEDEEKNEGKGHGKDHDKEDKKPMEEAMMEKEEEMGDDEAGMDPMGDMDALGDAPDMPDMGDEADSPVGDDAMQQAVKMVADKFAEAMGELGVDMSVEGSAEDDMGGLEDEEGLEDEGEEDELGAMSEVEVVEDDMSEDLVNEVARRVAKRILELKRG